MYNFLRSVFAIFTFSSFLFGQFTELPESQILSPVETPHGIIFTNSSTSSLFFYHNGVTEELVSSPGCGMYYTLSPDGSTIGFKYISDDGMQAPALFDIKSKKITLLHPPVPQAGQVSFSRSGAIAYSIGNEIFINNNSIITTIPIEQYSNMTPLSADGTIAAYTNSDNQIMTVDIRTQQREQITGGSTGYFLPAWSPVDNVLCYSSLGGSLFTYSSVTKATSVLGEGFTPAWTSDGKSIVAERREIEKQELINSDIYQISADGKNVVRLSDTKNIFESSPSAGSAGSILFGSHNSNSIYGLTAGQKTVTRATIAGNILSAVQTQAPTSLKKISSPAAYFEMPYTNQVYDTPDWYWGYYACGPTSSIMVIAYYGLLPSWNVLCSSPSMHTSAYGNYICEKYRFKGIDYSYNAVVNKKDSWGGYGYMWSTGSPHTRMEGYYSFHGLTAATQETPSLSFVTNEVTNGYPYTLCNGLTTAGHIIVINGIGAESHTLIANDPYGNKNSGSYPSRDGRGVSYDWPGFNNGHQNLNTVYWGVTVRYTPPAIGDTIVDDLQFTKGFSMSNSSPASMYSWKELTSGFNGHSWYVKTKMGDTCYAVWTPKISQDGMYDLSVYIPLSNAVAARYIVHNSQRVDTVIINQKQYKNSWVSLGSFPFTTSGAQYVRLGDGSDSVGQEIIFDAVQWKYKSPLTVQLPISRIPTTIALEQNFPNPFNPTTEIRFSIPSQNTVTLKVYSVLGQEVATLVNKSLGAGVYSVPFNAASLSSGMYLYRLQAGETSVVKRMTVLK